MTERLAIPEATARLFHGIEPAALAATAHRAFVVARVLDEGDRDDLRWLVRAVGEAEIVRHLEHSRGRGLSARSRAFCARVFGLSLPAPPPAGCWAL